MMANGTLEALALEQTGAASLDRSSGVPPVSGRIEGYDVARSIALFGMVIVNFQIIFSEYSFYAEWYNELFDLLFGRAAALFVMLAGVGLTLMSRRAYILSDSEGLQQVRRALFKRSLMLLGMGLLFKQWWNADILHFYSIFLTAGAVLLAAPARRLMGTALIIFLISAFFYGVTEGEPGLNGIFAASGLLAEIIDDLFFSGYYSVFPWLGFLVIGMWLGRLRMTSDTLLGRRLLIWAAAVFAGIQLAIEYLPLYVMEYVEVSETSVIDMFLVSDVFPATPLFMVSSAASSIMVIVIALMMTRYRLLSRFCGYLANTGKLTLTIYITHVFIGFGVHRLITSEAISEMHKNMSIFFPFLFCIMSVVFSNVWLTYFERGPLEWVLRRYSK